MSRQPRPTVEELHVEGAARTAMPHILRRMQQSALVRAPFSILRELLGEPDPNHGMEKTSTCFVYVFEGQDIAVYDFHKEEWAEMPLCRTDGRYVWNVSGDADLEPFCKWLSAKVIERMRATKTLDDAGRRRVNELIAEGLSLDEAMKRVRLVHDDLSEDYVWPPPSEEWSEPVIAKPAPKPAATPPVVRRQKK